VGRLEGKVALVTGAARGIGAAIAQAFDDEGAVVYRTDIADAAGAALPPGLPSLGVLTRLDVREEGDWAAATTAVLAMSARLDVLVNNAGITGLEAGGSAHDPEHAALEDWRAVHRTNLDGVFLGCRYAIRAMRPRRAGSIINLSSRSGLVGIPAAAAYASSKAAVRNHTKSVALWCAQQGLAIRCNSIHPGAILTPLWDPVLGEGPERAARLARLAKDTPLRRFGTAAEVAAAAVYLAADESAFVTGSELVIDGGLTAGAAGAPGPADA
jgi:NAD(P)-dependent dehydrogenase (short-subunit alcohol dehydrogenase family)